MSGEQTAWVVTDGRAGIENQALGLAEAVARLTPLKIIIKRARLTRRWSALPASLVRAPFDHLTEHSDTFDGPGPDLWIGCGRQSIPMTLAARDFYDQSPFRVQLQNPRIDPGNFDLVVAPEHDRIAGDNVVSMIGSPNRITASFIEEGEARLAKAGVALPDKPAGKPLIGVLIGGPNSIYSFGDNDIARLMTLLETLSVQGCSLVITASRRTPRAISEKIAALVGDANHYFDPNVSLPEQNPYPAILGVADYLIVTEDSVNMMCEAVTAGRETYLFSLTRKFIRRMTVFGENKFDRLRRFMVEQGHMRLVEDRLNSWSPKPLNETNRVAELLTQRWRQHKR